MRVGQRHGSEECNGNPHAQRRGLSYAQRRQKRDALNGRHANAERQIHGNGLANGLHCNGKRERRCNGERQRFAH